MKYYEVFACITDYNILNDGNDKICENDSIKETKSFKNFGDAIDQIKHYSDILIDVFSVFINRGNCIDYSINKQYLLLDLENDSKRPKNLHDISIRHEDCKIVSTIQLEYTDLNYEKHIEEHSFELYERIMSDEE